jgi:hypothetical protein
MVVNKGENITFTLQLVKSDGISVEEDATISYRIFDSTATVELVSSRSATYNSTTKSYVDNLIPSTSWPTQEVGSYLVIWSVADTTDDFNSVYTEPLEINIDNTDVQKILGLVHSNMVIDNTVFDKEGNLYKARVTLYKDSAKTEVLARYQVNAVTTGPGKFATWEQIET